MMEALKRCSPVSFERKPRKTEILDNWTVVLEYEGEGDGPHLIDLSHRPKWDVQDVDISAIRPWGIQIPELPGDCQFEKGILINRMNRTQAACWHLIGDSPISPEGSAYTETTDAFLLVALLGKEVFSIMEKVSALDLRSPTTKSPFLMQGPVLHVPCQAVVLGPRASVYAILVACARGFGQSMAEALLDAGEEWGLVPAGETAFSHWLKT